MKLIPLCHTVFAAFSFVMFCTASVSVCIAQTKSPITQRSGNQLRNEFFGFTLTVPNTWYAQSEDELNVQAMRGAKLIGGGDGNKTKLYEAMMKSSIQLAGLYEKPPGTPGGAGASFAMVAENIEALPGIRSGCDYLEHVRVHMKAAPHQFKAMGACTSQSHNGTQYGTMAVTGLTLGEETRQRYTVRLINRYAIAIIQSGRTKAEFAKTEPIFSSLKFDE